MGVAINSSSRLDMKTLLVVLCCALALQVSSKNCKKNCNKPCNKKPKVKPAPAGGPWCGNESQCDANDCAIPCPLPLGYYADPNDCSAYCYCSGVDAMDKNSGVRVPSRYEKCPNGLLWDPLCQGYFKWLPGQKNNLGSDGGCCNWPSMVKTDHCKN